MVEDKMVEDKQIGWKIQEQIGIGVYNPAVKSVLMSCEECGACYKKGEGINTCERLNTHGVMNCWSPPGVIAAEDEE